MAVKLSTEKVKVKNGIIGKRRKLDNPVEDLISISGIRIKSYDKTQINIKRYLSSEDIRIFQDMPPARRQQVIEQFMSSPEYSKLEETVRESDTGNFIQDSISESSLCHSPAPDIFRQRNTSDIRKYPLKIENRAAGNSSSFFIGQITIQIVFYVIYCST